MDTQQHEEIKTIKERNINIKLSDADVERLCKKVGEAGLTVSELFENFVGDLVGTYGNGSDERTYANQWFDRCWFGMDFGERSFLQWLITNDSVSEAVDSWRNLQEAKKELQEFQIEDESDEEYADNCKQDISYFEEILNDMFNEYKDENTVNNSSTLESEMDKVIQWQDEMTKLKDSITCIPSKAPDSTICECFGQLSKENNLVNKLSTVRQEAHMQNQSKHVTKPEISL